MRVARRNEKLDLLQAMGVGSDREVMATRTFVVGEMPAITRFLSHLFHRNKTFGT